MDGDRQKCVCHFIAGARTLRPYALEAVVKRVHVVVTSKRSHTNLK